MLTMKRLTTLCVIALAFSLGLGVGLAARSDRTASTSTLRVVVRQQQIVAEARGDYQAKPTFAHGIRLVHAIATLRDWQEAESSTAPRPDAEQQALWETLQRQAQTSDEKREIRRLYLRLFVNERL